MILTFRQPVPSQEQGALPARLQEIVRARGFTPADSQPQAPGVSSPGSPDPGIEVSHPRALLFEQEFRRGNWWGNLFGFRMDRLRQRLHVMLAPAEADGIIWLTTRYEVDTTLQYISSNDQRFFQEEAAVFLDALAGQQDPTSRLNRVLRRSRLEMILVLLISSMLGLLVTYGLWRFGIRL